MRKKLLSAFAIALSMFYLVGCGQQADVNQNTNSEGLESNSTAISPENDSNSASESSATSPI